MQWYTWLPWVLLFILIVGIILYFVFKPKPKTLTELNNKVKELEETARNQKNELVALKVQKINAEKAQAKAELDLLEKEYGKQLQDLSLEERKNYEKAREDPKSGVDYIKSLLGK